MANSALTFTFVDYSGEKSTVTFPHEAVTAPSLPNLLSWTGALRGAVQAVTLGNVANEQMIVFNTPLGAALPTDHNAQRERKWLVVNEGFRKLFTLEIPTADIVNRLLPGTDIADPADPDIQALVSQMQAHMRSPYGGTIEVVSISAVGRNL